MTFSSLAGSVGGGQQTPGFIGIGKVFLTSRKFLFAEGGFKRLVWMPKELKQLLAADLNKRFDEIGIPDLLDKIADESIGCDTKDIRDYLRKVGHPALEMEEMSEFAEQIGGKEENLVEDHDKVIILSEPDKQQPGQKEDKQIGFTAGTIEQIKNQILAELKAELKATIQKEVVTDIINTLSNKFLGTAFSGTVTSAPGTEAGSSLTKIDVPLASERIDGIKSFKLPVSTCAVPIWEVKLGATKSEGGHTWCNI